jgi:hypothetical protein
MKKIIFLVLIITLFSCDFNYLYPPKVDDARYNYYKVSISVSNFIPNNDTDFVSIEINPCNNNDLNNRLPNIYNLILEDKYNFTFNEHGLYLSTSYQNSYTELTFPDGVKITITPF